jgi:serine/threonine-protein kinase
LIRASVSTTRAAEQFDLSASKFQQSVPVGLYGSHFSPGALVGGYLIEELCHQGFIATLYRARHERTSKIAALKVFQQQLLDSAKLLQRFQQEATALRQLRHPHIVEIWDAATLHDGRPYIAMEWLDGRNVAQELQARGPFSAREALVAMEQLGSALAEAHRLDIVHRDLKAQNVVVLRQGDGFTLKLVDFGVAKLLNPQQAAPGLTSTGVLVGTPSAMAPEQIRGESLDARTDIYAMGILLFQLLTGQLPFSGRNAIELEEMHLHAPPPRPGDRVPVPEVFDKVVLRCFQKRPADRFQNVSQLLHELRSAFGPHEGRRAERNAIALYVEVQLLPTSSDVEDERAWESADRVMLAARAQCQTASLPIVLVAGNAFLVAKPLAPDADEAMRIRDSVLEFAIELYRKVETEARPDVRILVALHVDQATIGHTPEGKESVTGGPLLSLTQWAAGHPGGGVIATASALEGIERRSEFVSLPGSASSFQLQTKPASP